jgi:hypothetical protein
MNRTIASARLTAIALGAVFVIPSVGGRLEPARADFHLQEATIADIQTAIRERQPHLDPAGRGIPRAHQGLQRHLRRAAAGGPGSDQDEAPCRADQRAADAELMAAARRAHGFDDRKARSMTDAADADPSMPDALEVAAEHDRKFAATGQLVGPLHGVVIAVKDQYDTRDMRTTSGADGTTRTTARPRSAHSCKRLRDAGAIIIAKANMGSTRPRFRAARSAACSATRTTPSAARAARARGRVFGGGEPGHLRDRGGDRLVDPRSGERRQRGRDLADRRSW